MNRLLHFSLMFLCFSLFFTKAQSTFPRLVRVSGQSQDQGKVNYEYFYTGKTLDSIVSEQKNFKLKQIFSYQSDGKIAEIEEMQWSNYRQDWYKANLYVYSYSKAGLLKSIAKKVMSGTSYNEYEDYSYGYDKQGRLILVDVYDYSRDFSYKEIHYTYDEKGRKNKMITKQSIGEGEALRENKREEYVYNDADQLIQKNTFVLYNGAMTADKVISYTYDSAGGCTEIATTPVGIKFASEIRRFTNNTDIPIKNVFLGTTPQSYFPDFEACDFVRLTEEILLADLNGKYSRHSQFTYTYADLPKSEKAALSFTIDGSVSNLSFSVTTAQPESLVKVVFPDGSIAEEKSDKEYGIARFGKKVAGGKQGQILIYAQDIVALASQQTGISQLDLTSTPKLKRLTIPFQTLTTIDLSHTPFLEELYLQGCTQLKEVDITPLKGLKRLNISNNTTTQVRGLDEAFYLEHLIAYNSNLRNPNPKNWKQIKTLDLVQTQLETIDLSSNVELERLELTDNRLTSINLGALTKLKVLKVGKNQLQKIDLSSCKKLEELDVNGNQLTRLEIHSSLLDNLDCGNNNLSLAALPEKGQMTTYIYWPQGAFPLPETIETQAPLNLHELVSLTGVLGAPSLSEFAVIDEQGKEYEPETYYSLENGVFTFKQSMETPVRIRVLNKAFPKLTGKAASHSTLFRVKKGGSVNLFVEEIPYTIQDNRLIVSSPTDAGYSIFDISGRCIFQASENSDNEISLRPGNYLLLLGAKSYKIHIP